MVESLAAVDQKKQWLGVSEINFENLFDFIANVISVFFSVI